MSIVLRGIGQLFGFGKPKVDKTALAAENRAKLAEQTRGAELEQQAEAQRIRSASSGRRAALASQIRDTLG